MTKLRLSDVKSLVQVTLLISGRPRTSFLSLISFHKSAGVTGSPTRGIRYWGWGRLWPPPTMWLIIQQDLNLGLCDCGTRALSSIPCCFQAPNPGASFSRVVSRGHEKLKETGMCQMSHCPHFLVHVWAGKIPWNSIFCAPESQTTAPFCSDRKMHGHLWSSA